MNVSIILNCHAEGLLVHRTINALEIMREYALKKGVSSEVIVVLDKPNDSTKEYFKNPKNTYDYKIFEVSIGDLGLSRNYGVEKATGKYIAFQDADDIFCENWLYNAFKFSESLTEEVVLHTEYSITFGSEKTDVWQRFSSTDKRCNLATYIAYNHYDALCFTTRNILLKIKYSLTIPGTGFGYEDWDWNCRIIAEGIQHYVVPNTVLFIRRKKTGSLLSAHNVGKSIIPPNSLFFPDNFIKLFENQTKKLDFSKNISNHTPKKLEKLHKASYKVIENIKSLVYERVKNRRRKHFFSYRIDTFLKIQLEALDILIKKLESNTNSNIEIPEWLIGKWKIANRIEPNIEYSAATLQNTIYYSIPTTSELANSYYECCQGFEGTYDHVFVIPWIKMGGADLVILNYVNGLKQKYPTDRILVISTEPSKSEWIQKLNNSVSILEVGIKYPHLDFYSQCLLVSRILLQFGTKNLHLIQSSVGYQTIEYFGKAISSLCNIYVHAFCQDYDNEGNQVGYILENLYSIYPHITKVITENKNIIHHLKNIYGYDEEKFHCIYQPVKHISSTVKESTRDRKLKVLWSGRFDKQKRPDLLGKIANKLLNENIEIDVYGKSVLDNHFDLSSLLQLKNVNYKGEYKKWDDIQPEQYDIFLYTSGYDGVPNVVLEALSSGLIVIGALQGGMNEIIHTGQNGYLVNKNENIEAYIEKIIHIENNRHLKVDFFEYTKTLLLKNHTYDTFNEQLAFFKPKDYTDLVHKEKALISVLLPVYNSEKYLPQAIESILNQTYTNFELIIFNDGSTDKSGEIINQYSDSRIKVITNPHNKGLVHNLNVGIEISNGKYIARMDADDISLPGRFEKQVDLLEKNEDIGICGTWFKLFDEKGYTKILMHPEKHDEIVLTMMLKHNAIGHPTAMFRKDLFDSKKIIYKQDYFKAEDYKLWTEASIHTKLANLQEVQLLYRWHKSNISSNNIEFQKNLDYQIKKEFIEEFLLDRKLNTEEENTFKKILATKDIGNTKDFQQLIIDQNNKKHLFDASVLNKYLGIEFI